MRNKSKSLPPRIPTEKKGFCVKGHIRVPIATWVIAQNTDEAVELVRQRSVELRGPAGGFSGWSEFVPFSDSSVPRPIEDADKVEILEVVSIPEGEVERCQELHVVLPPVEKP